MINKKQNSYCLIDSGKGRKLEQFGRFRLSRPSAQAVWSPQLPQKDWEHVDAIFTRDEENKWITFPQFKNTPWIIEIAHLQFKVMLTDFGHLGVFPEQQDFWLWLQQYIQQAKQRKRQSIEVLNLFAYSGGATLAAAKAGARVCHLDASKGMVTWARENASLNHLDQAPIRWIVDDVRKFLKRELRRGMRYDGIILDPPSFGRGAKGEVFKIEEDLPSILEHCRELLTEHPLFVLFTSHTPGFSPLVMHHLLSQMMEDFKGIIDQGEMVLKGEEKTFPLPSGTFSRWVYL